MTGPSKPTTDDLYRVFRGGSWNYMSATFVRAAYRLDIAPSSRGNRVGFRCSQRGVRMPVGKVTP